MTRSWSDPVDCKVCGQRLHFRWTIKHGVAECVICQTPYKVYHYDEEGNLDKYPELWLRDEFVEDAKEFYEERGQGLRKDDAFHRWMQNKDKEN